MRELYRFLLATLFFTLSLHTGVQGQQKAWNPEKYDGIPSMDLHTIIYDEFEDNRNAWNLESRHVELSIENGDFYLNNLSSSVLEKLKNFNFEVDGDYQIEIRLRFVRGSDLNGIGLTFGKDYTNNEYNFYFNQNNQYKISQRYNHTTRDIKPWTHKESIGNYSHNTLTVRKVGSRWYFFVNKEMVHACNSHPLFGDMFGFILGAKTAMEVDYFKIDEVKPMDNVGPVISIASPIFSGPIYYSNEQKFRITGRVEDKSGVKTLIINNQPIGVEPSGAFSHFVDLKYANRQEAIELLAEDFYGNTSRTEFYANYIYRPGPSIASNTNTSRPSEPGSREGSGAVYYPTSGTGKNYLLLIGINDYTYWNSLNNAVKDCRDLSDVLTSMYQFDSKHVLSLYNTQATRENILETLESLQDMITENDNLLIYYAGHGYYDQGSGLGYWVPTGARQGKIPDYISNSTIHDYLKTIKSKHTFLIADACYSGSLFATRDDGILSEERISRWAFTSGSIEKVWDGAPGQNSPFASYLLKFLRTSYKSKLYAYELIENVKMSVSRNTRQTPMGSALQNVGDEGGIFVFYRKK